MFQNILVPVDFTSKNLRALQFALKLAAQNKGKITLLHVIEPVEYIPPGELKEFYKKLERNAQSKMKVLIKRSLKNVPVERIILYGKRAAEIAKYAATRKIDLIVLSSHRIQPGSGVGTVSYTAAVLSPKPVLLVK